MKLTETTTTETECCLSWEFISGWLYCVSGVCDNSYTFVSDEEIEWLN